MNKNIPEQLAGYTIPRWEGKGLGTPQPGDMVYCSTKWQLSSAFGCGSFAPKLYYCRPLKSSEKELNEAIEMWKSVMGSILFSEKGKENLQIIFDAALVQNNKWYFPSKGEFPIAGKLIEVGYESGRIEQITSTVGDGEPWPNSPIYAYCWRYCEPLPPRPPEHTNKNFEFEDWWRVSKYGYPQIKEKEANEIWSAAQDHLK